MHKTIGDVRSAGAIAILCPWGRSRASTGHAPRDVSGWALLSGNHRAAQGTAQYIYIYIYIYINIYK